MNETEKLINLIEVLTDPSDLTDDEVRAELLEAGIDPDKSKATFEAWLDTEMAERKERRKVTP